LAAAAAMLVPALVTKVPELAPSQPLVVAMREVEDTKNTPVAPAQYDPTGQMATIVAVPTVRSAAAPMAPTW